MYFDCAAVSFGRKQLVAYMRRASVYSKVIPENQVALQDVIPGSIAEGIVAAVCPRR
jgi:hypothetical protein